MKSYSNKYILFVILIFVNDCICAQMIQPYAFRDSVIVYPPGCYQKFDANKFIVPAIMIAYGFAALHIDGLTDISEGIQEETWG
ncbi:MAG: hypothetical protein WDM78_12210 [Puia sp.]